MVLHLTKVKIRRRYSPMDKNFLAALRSLKKQAAEAERALLSHLLSMAEIEAKSMKKAA
jgi:hypothetical protein